MTALHLAARYGHIDETNQLKEFIPLRTPSTKVILFFSFCYIFFESILYFCSSVNKNLHYIWKKVNKKGSGICKT